MSRIVQCNFDPACLKPILDAWVSEADPDRFHLELSVDKGIIDLRRMVVSHDADVLLLVIDEKVVGFLGLLLFVSPLSDQRIANEHYWYVLPNYRKGKNPIKLLRAAEQWAEEKQCTHLMLNASNLASGRMKEVVKLYEHRGFHLFESTYIKEVNHNGLLQCSETKRQSSQYAQPATECPVG